ncbi:Uncharacterised protein [Serratia ficaria]|nr:Uncharacterised protein [Serratia ficaria]CAI1698246.1 Uncharacterised protein [Serratia ficaria]
MNDAAHKQEDVEKAARVFAINELAPLQERLCELNEWAGEDVISFKPYELLSRLNNPVA